MVPAPQTRTAAVRAPAAAVAARCTAGLVLPMLLLLVVAPLLLLVLLLSHRQCWHGLCRR